MLRMAEAQADLRLLKYFSPFVLKHQPTLEEGQSLSTSTEKGPFDNTNPPSPMQQPSPNPLWIL